ncbi:MAG: outer membrane protein assembly factor BamA [Magnetospiraceae bacterium]
MFVLAVLVACTAGWGTALAQSSGGVVQQVRVEGTQRIEADTVRSYVLIKEGDLFDQQRINDSLKNLFATGLFADVSLRREGGALVVTVIENPIINRIAFEGNDLIEDTALAGELVLRSRVIYTRTKVQDDVRRLLTLYRRSGRFAATVEPKIIELDQNRVDLVFEIDEGPETEVRSIRFIGNKAFSDGSLRDVIRTRETAWYNFFSSDDNYDPDRIAFDRELLRRFYLRKGYADFSVKSAVAELESDRQGFFITYTIEEGERYKYGVVDTVIGLKGLTPEEIDGIVDVSEGDWFNANEVEDLADDLTTHISELGYNFVRVDPRLRKNVAESTIDLRYEIVEGPRLIVERIDISGNLRTLDEVIRREFRLVEGDAFNVAKMRRSRQRLENLDFFQAVEVERVPGTAADRTVIDVKVQEKSTGSLSFGVGFSTDSGPLADVTLRERNLLGRGQDLDLTVSWAAENSEIDLSFTEPYFLDRDVSAGFDLFHITRDNQDSSSYDLQQSGGGLRVSYPLTENLRQGWRYTLEYTDLTNISPSASRFIRDQEGASLLNEIGHSLTYDRRDSALFPSEGYVLQMNNDIAGLVGDNQYLRNTFRGAYYYPLEEFRDGWVVKLEGTVGHMIGLGKDIRIDQRYFVGGDSLRGFERAGIGPRDLATGDSLGGNITYYGTLELRFPLGLPEEYQVLGKLFGDFGSLYDVDDSGAGLVDESSVRASVGTGFLWISPMGPIGVDFAIPILQEDYDKEENLRVNFGTRF